MFSKWDRVSWKRVFHCKTDLVPGDGLPSPHSHHKWLTWAKMGPTHSLALQYLYNSGDQHQYHITNTNTMFSTILLLKTPSFLQYLCQYLHNSDVIPLPIATLYELQYFYQNLCKRKDLPQKIEAWFFSFMLVIVKVCWGCNQKCFNVFMSPAAATTNDFTWVGGSRH